MSISPRAITLWAGLALATGNAYNVPKTQPSNAAALDPTPVGPSFEFFMWPSYMRNITPVHECMTLFDELYGQKTPIRIGGTTQDRATYDPDFEGYVSYRVDDPLDAPMTLIFGPKYFDLIPEHGANTTIGFNRGHNNRTNAFAAIAELKERALPFVEAIELGNEPDLYYDFWNHPVATPPWTAAQEGADAADWAQDFANRWGSPLPVLAGGGYAIPFEYRPDWPNLPYLINEAYNESVKAATKEYNGHMYAFSDVANSNLQQEMKHTRVVSDLKKLPMADAFADGKPYVIGETGFHGEDYIMDQQFGGAIQIVDKTLLALSMGVQRLYYHQGTINQAFFNWWLNGQVNTPFYGGYVAALATQGADHITADDDGTSLFAQYTLYKDGKPNKIVFVNTDFHSGKGKRASHVFGLQNLSACKLEVVRMTAPSSYTETTRDQKKTSLEPSIGGQYFSNDDCSLQGKAKKEHIAVKGGSANIKVYASEVVILYLK